MTLPVKPVQGVEEASAAFDARMLNWWRECDITLRTECGDRQTQWLATVGPAVTPTLNRIADAWDAMDTRLGELATALSGSSPIAGGLSGEFVLSILRLVLDKPETP